MNSEHDLRKRLGLHPRLPPERSFVSLSHAVSWIAFRRSIAGPVLSRLIGIGKPPLPERITPNKLLDEAIISAVDKLTDLALGGNIEILGKLYAHVLDDDGNYRIPTERVPTERLADYRGFDPLDDSLFPGEYREIKLAWNDMRTETLSPLGRHYRFVIVNRTDLMREFPDKAGASPNTQPFTDMERKEWIKRQPQQSADAAHKKYKGHPRYDGSKQFAFREEWRAERGTRLGRPSKKL